MRLAQLDVVSVRSDVGLGMFIISTTKWGIFRDNMGI